MAEEVTFADFATRIPFHPDLAYTLYRLGQEKKETLTVKPCFPAAAPAAFSDASATKKKPAASPIGGGPPPPAPPIGGGPPPPAPPIAPGIPGAPPIAPADKSSVSSKARADKPPDPRIAGVAGSLLEGLNAVKLKPAKPIPNTGTPSKLPPMGVLDGGMVAEIKKFKFNKPDGAGKSMQQKDGKSLQVKDLEVNKKYKIVPNKSDNMYVAKLKTKTLVKLTWEKIEGQPFWRNKQEKSLNGGLVPQSYGVFHFQP